MSLREKVKRVSARSSRMPDGMAHKFSTGSNALEEKSGKLITSSEKPKCHSVALEKQHGKLLVVG